LYVYVMNTSAEKFKYKKHVRNLRYAMLPALMKFRLCTKKHSILHAEATNRRDI
jgi:hypothetical protein